MNKFLTLKSKLGESLQNESEMEKQRQMDKESDVTVKEVIELLPLAQRPWASTLPAITKTQRSHFLER